MILEILTIIIGLALLIYGADILIKGASSIAKRFHIPEAIIGLTIVAIGTSMPELIITINSAAKNHTDLIIGNAIGSNLCNLLLILGLISVIRPVKIDKETRNIHLPIALLSAALLFMIVNGVFGTEQYMINKFEGFILLLFSVLYFTYPIYIEVKDIVKTNTEKKQKQLDKPDEKHHKKTHPMLKIFFNIIIGIILLKYGSDFVVNNASSIAEHLGISQRIIGLTIVAIGTALPEFVTSIVATIKKDTDMAVRKFSGVMYIEFMYDNWYWCSYNTI